MRLVPCNAMPVAAADRRSILNSAGVLGLAFLILLVTSHPSEAQRLRWAKQPGGSDFEEGRAIAVDQSGNSYVTGAFEVSATFGLGEVNQTTLVATGASDIFVAKYSSSGALQWAKRAGGTGSGEGFGIRVDGSGNSYVTGSFEGSGTFGLGEANQITLTSDGDFDIFVAKYNSSGALLWAKRAGGTGSDGGSGIAVDGSGNSYVTGSFEGSGTFGLGEANQITLTSDGDFDIFVAKYNSSGALLWAKRAGGTARDEGSGIAVDGSANSYVTGSFEGSATFGLGEANQITLTSDGDFDIFIAKYNSSGALLWAKRAGGTGSDGGSGIAVDASGNSYVTGNFSGTATFGFGEANQKTLTSEGDFDIFIAKYNSSGALLWAKRAGGTSLDEGFGIAVDGSGNSYVTGYFDGPATFGLGEVNQIVLGSGTGFDIFVAKYNSSGALLWAKRAGGASIDEGFGIAVDGSGNSYVTGSFEGTATFGLGEVNQTVLTSGGSDDIFIAKFFGSKAGGDFDGDSKADIGVYRNGAWFILKSSGGSQIVGWGAPGDIPVPADYDGDGKTDDAIYRNGAWFILKSSGGSQVVGWGTAGDIAVPGDYDGDGKSDVAVFRNGTWFILKSTGGSQVVGWGAPGDIAVPADYDGDGKSDVAVFRNGTWFIMKSTGGSQVVGWGAPGDIPVPADYDGDGKSDVGVFRNGTWFILKSTGGSQVVGWGAPGDIAVPADYDGDGKSDVAVFRNGTWFILNSTGGSQVVGWGTAGDVPIY
jgi:Beta-propeller repeat